MAKAFLKKLSTSAITITHIYNYVDIVLVMDVYKIRIFEDFFKGLKYLKFVCFRVARQLNYEKISNTHSNVFDRTL